MFQIFFGIDFFYSNEICKENSRLEDTALHVCMNEFTHTPLI